MNKISKLLIILALIAMLVSSFASCELLPLGGNDDTTNDGSDDTADGGNTDDNEDNGSSGDGNTEDPGENPSDDPAGNPSDDPADDPGKKDLYTIVQALAGEFKEQIGSIICREILKNPASDPNPTPRNAEFYAKRPCARMVFTAADLLERYIQEHPLEG